MVVNFNQNTIGIFKICKWGRILHRNAKGL